MQDTFNGGYTKALLDVQKYIEQHSDCLKLNRIFTAQNIPKLMQALIDNREELRERGDCELTWNPKEKKFISDRKGGS